MNINESFKSQANSLSFWLKPNLRELKIYPTAFLSYHLSQLHPAFYTMMKFDLKHQKKILVFTQGSQSVSTSVLLGAVVMMKGPALSARTVTGEAQSPGLRWAGTAHAPHGHEKRGCGALLRPTPQDPETDDPPAKIQWTCVNTDRLFKEETHTLRVVCSQQESCG